MIRFAVIGTSFITEWFLDAAKECKELQFAAVCSRDIQRGKEFAKRYGGEKVYIKPEELAQASDIDAVYIRSYKIGYIIAHPPVFHNGNDARQQENDSYRAECKCQFYTHRHFHRKKLSEKLFEHRADIICP